MKLPVPTAVVRRAPVAKSSREPLVTKLLSTTSLEIHLKGLRIRPIFLIEVADVALLLEILQDLHSERAPKEARKACTGCSTQLCSNLACTNTYRRHPTRSHTTPLGSAPQPQGLLLARTAPLRRVHQVHLAAASRQTDAEGPGGARRGDEVVAQVHLVQRRALGAERRQQLRAVVAQALATGAQSFQKRARAALL